MTRLPTPGSDDGNWGAILNDYLYKSHDSSGNLKPGSVGTSQIANGAISKAMVGLGSVDNTADADKPISTAAQTALNDKIGTSEKGAANGVASLDNTAHLPESQVPTRLSQQALLDLIESGSGSGGSASVSTFSVHDYGAIGNGTTDDTTAIQAAIAAAATAGGGHVLFGSKTYKVSSQINISNENIHLSGQNKALWGPGASRIQVEPGLTGAVFNITKGKTSVSGLHIQPRTGNLTVTAVAATGAGMPGSGNQLEAILLSDLYINNTGGIAFTNVVHGMVRNVDVQNWNGGTDSAGMYFRDCQIVYLLNSNSAARTDGSATNCTYNWYFRGCITMISFGCESNNRPYIGAMLKDNNDSKWYDFEFNAAMYAQVRIEGGNDNQWHNIYIWIPAPYGVQAIGTDVMQLQGGWIGNATTCQVQVISCHRFHMSGLTIVCDQGTGLEITDNGTLSQGPAIFSNNIFHEIVTGETGVKVGLTMAGGPLLFPDNVWEGVNSTSGTGMLIDSNSASIYGFSIVGGVFRNLSKGIELRSGDFATGTNPPIISSVFFGLDVATPLTEGVGMTGNTPIYSGNSGIPNAGGSGGGGMVPSRQTASNITFEIDDANALVEGNATSALTFTIPNNSAVAFPIGTRIGVFQMNTGGITLAAASGVDLWNSSTTKSTTGQYETLYIRKRDTNTWVVESQNNTFIPNAKTANYTLSWGDQGHTVEADSASALTFTVPNNTTVPFPVGTEIEIFQVGNGAVTVAAASGVSVWFPGGGSVVTSGQYQTLHLRKRDTNVWVAIASLASSSGSSTWPAKVANGQSNDYTPVISDAGKVIEMDSSSARTVTLPTDGSVPYPIGTIIDVFQMGTGAVTIVPGSGTNFWTPSGSLASVKTAVQYQTLSFRKRDASGWVLLTPISGSPLKQANAVGGNYTLQSSDAGKVIECDSSGSMTLTIPLHSAVPYDIGTEIEVFQMGNGIVTIAGAGGTNIWCTGGGNTLATSKFSLTKLRKREQNTWVVTS